MFKSILFLLVSISSSLAASRYVDSAAGSGGNGQSWATAWNSLTKITGVGGGDTVYISGGASGKTYDLGNNSWDPPKGSAGNPITYQTGQEAGHNGMVTIKLNAKLFWSSPAYLTLSGEVNGQRRMTIDTWSVNDDHNKNTDQFRLLYVNVEGAAWFSYSDHTEIGWCYWTAPLSTTDDSMIAHIGDGRSKGYGMNSVHDSTFIVPRKKTQGQGFDCFKHCFNTDFYNNNIIAQFNSGYTGGQHNDGYQGNGSYTRFWNNYFENFISYSIYVEAQPSSSNVQIWNNVFNFNDPGVDWAAHGTVAIGFTGSPGTIANIMVANNSIYWSGQGANGTCRGISLGGPSPGTTGTVTNCFSVNNLGSSNLSYINEWNRSGLTVANNVKMASSGFASPGGLYPDAGTTV
jgi:hypothetical protein